jgi:chaperonin GroES
MFFLTPIAIESHMYIEPLFDRILVEPYEVEGKTKGGLVLPDEAHPERTRGKVLAVGIGPLTSSGEIGPMPISVGDDIIYTHLEEHETQGEKFYICRLQHVAAVVK